MAFGNKPEWMPYSVYHNVRDHYGMGYKMPQLYELAEELLLKFFNKDSLSKVQQIDVNWMVDPENGEPLGDEDSDHYESKEDKNLNDYDSWKTTILDSDSETKFVSDEDNKQEIAYRGESIVGIYDKDLNRGFIKEAEETYASREEWEKSLGTDNTTFEKSVEDDGVEVVVAKDAQGNIIGTYTKTNNQEAGVNIKEASPVNIKSLVQQYSNNSNEELEAMISSLENKMFGEDIFTKSHIISIIDRIKRVLDYRKLNESTNSNSQAVYMFGPDNSHQYLLGYYDRLKGETDSEFLDRLVKIKKLSSFNRDNASLEKRKFGESTNGYVYLGRDRATWINDRYSDDVGLFSSGEAQQLASQLGGKVTSFHAQPAGMYDYVVFKQELLDKSKKESVNGKVLEFTHADVVNNNEVVYQNLIAVTDGEGNYALSNDGSVFLYNKDWSEDPTEYFDDINGKPSSTSGELAVLQPKGETFWGVYDDNLNLISKFDSVEEALYEVGDLKESIKESFQDDKEWLSSSGWKMKSSGTWEHIKAGPYYLKRMQYPGRPWGVCSRIQSMCYPANKLDGTVKTAAEKAFQLNKADPEGRFY